ncbi:high choriolytic enzyme 2-like [Xyrichtys novacula]|nr:high choriolytic enzyme 2-like [Xyrichtys novacula]
MWPKTGRTVYIPIVISSSYNNEEKNIIINSLVSFHRSTCIRFVWRRRQHRNYIYFYSDNGCFSYVGRQNRGQPISLSQRGCLYLDTVQHEVLHALGFHHEQVRSDRDEHVTILTQNIQPGTESNFRKEQTKNLGTPYDFNSVMHYSNYAFSKNGRPTIVAKKNPNLEFGRAPRMSQNDIDRVNKLYRCFDDSSLGSAWTRLPSSARSHRFPGQKLKLVYLSVTSSPRASRQQNIAWRVAEDRSQFIHIQQLSSVSLESSSLNGLMGAGPSGADFR